LYRKYSFKKKYLEDSDKKEDDIDLLREQDAGKEDPEYIINAGRNNERICKAMFLR